MTREELGKMTMSELHAAAQAARMSTGDYYKQLIEETPTKA